MFLVESVQRRNRTDIVIFSRNKDGEKEIKTDKTFRPYFYVPEKNDIPKDNRIVGVETGHTTLVGEPVKKIKVQQSKDVPGLRSEFSKHYEADITVTQRYIIDVIGEAEVYPLKVMCLDIETDSVDEFPNIEAPNQAIISCSFCDNRGNKKVLLYKPTKCKEQLEDSDVLKIYDTEEDLLNGILSYIKYEDPDVLTGWNIKGFDLPYLINRMAMFKVDYYKMSPMAFVKYDEKREDVIIKGRVVMDMMRAYKHFRKITNQGKAERYSLEYTAQDQLGKGKLPHEEKFHELWVNNPKKLIEYNLRDSELVIELNDKLEIIDFFNTIRAKSFANLNQIYHTSALVDGYLLRTVHNKVVLPSKNKTRGDKYLGAFVFSPEPGVYDNILAFDVKGMYPNIIKTFNVGYDSFNPEGEIKLKDGIAFNRGEGIISKSMKMLDKERNFYKRLRNEAKDDNTRKLNNYRQYAIKVLMNSFYGYLGYTGSRLYKREVAEAITTWGQLIIKHTYDFLVNLGYEIVYGDTDSIYVKSKETSPLAIMKEGDTVLKAINNSYLDFAKTFGAEECTVEMEFEKVFKRIIFIEKKGEGGGAKKRYAYTLLWVAGDKATNDVKCVGFDLVRSDTARISGETQRAVIEMIFAGKTKEEIVKYLREIDYGIRNGKISPEEFGFPKGISKSISKYGVSEDDDGNKKKAGTPPVIVGAKYSNKYLGTRFREGDKPKWIYIKQVPPGYPETHVLAFEETIPDGFVPDYDVMIDKLFRMKLEALFKSAGFGEFPSINSTINKLPF